MLKLTQIRALPHKIHPKKSFFTIGTFSAPHCFISNAHLMLVCTHLCPPKPGWFTEDDCMSVANLLDLNVCALFRRRKGALSDLLPKSFGKLGSNSVLPQVSLLHYNLWQENKPPPGLHHKTCQSFYQK